ncbi:LytR/AlgR family response regulator transcription factor [Sporomusa malonica]|uniref:Two component transcriptional regulator, LytTR family n=1 Tax=Sporomusa malonica TaxID=112901 RepID=A0A1W2CWW9_9FIRM|nr:LytTR family DNA-binding domain-containing protein [Sporomusa malonica]SMC89711.1 two component transcriptional regulator, LytTR family [Sporomusa malonica]
MQPQINLLIAEDEPFQQELLLMNLKPFDFVHVVDMVKNGDELIHKATTIPNINALLLDLNLGKGRGGLESYAALRLRGKELPAVLVTGVIPEASYTYDLGVIDIVEKPFTPFRFKQAVERLSKHIDYQNFVQHGGLYIPVFSQDIEQLVPSEVLFIESLNRTIYVHTRTAVLETKIPLRVYCKYLESHYFYLTHRSFLVNMKQVHSIEGNVIHFANEKRTALIAEDIVQEIVNYWHDVIKR